MITAKIEERNHRLNDVIARQNASPTTISLFEQIVNGIYDKLRTQGKPVFSTTHIGGVSGFCNSRKAFVFIDLGINHVRTHYWTGRGSIPGLRKANWLQGGDKSGSETIRIDNTAAIGKAVEFACAAYNIAVSEYGKSK